MSDAPTSASDPPVRPPAPSAYRLALGLWPGRSQLQKVAPSVFISNAAGARSLEALTAAGITHVLNCATELRPAHPSAFTYHTAALVDVPSCDLVGPLGPALAFVGAAVGSGGVVLVHCAKGESRSGAMVVAHRMRALGETYALALAAVRAARPIVEPNEGFQRQLLDLEASGYFRGAEGEASALTTTTTTTTGLAP